MNRYFKCLIIKKQFIFIKFLKILKNNRERVYGEQNSGEWWSTAESSLPIGAELLSIILYSDATNCDTLGKSSLHPIYISLGNISIWRRNKSDIKQLWNICQ